MKCTECGKRFEPECDEEEICPACQRKYVPEATMTLGQQLAKKRWAGKTAAERSAHASEMAKARHKKTTKKQRSEMMKRVRAAGKQKHGTASD